MKKAKAWRKGKVEIHRWKKLNEPREFGFTVPCKHCLQFWWEKRSLCLKMLGKVCTTKSHNIFRIISTPTGKNNSLGDQKGTRKWAQKGRSKFPDDLANKMPIFEGQGPCGANWARHWYWCNNFCSIQFLWRCSPHFKDPNDSHCGWKWPNTFHLWNHKFGLHIGRENNFSPSTCDWDHCH